MFVARQVATHWAQQWGMINAPGLVVSSGNVLGKSGIMSLLRTALVVAASLATTIAPLRAAEFTFNEKTNEEMARKLKIPVYFALPASARAPLAQSFKTTDRLIDFKHPEAKGSAADVGLRLVVSKRAGLSKRLGQSGLFQTGDILLTFRPEWGGAGAYPNIQMGVSHTGVAYIKDGELHNIDNPLNAEYLGSRMRGDLTGEHYGTLKFIHVVRPRGLTDAQRANILTWATRLTTNASRVYPKQISFNQDYNAPKFKEGKPIEFVKQFGQIGLGQNPGGNLDMFCSEFVWSLLALRNCDPAKDGEYFKGNGIPSCVSPVMQPMEVTGDYMTRRGRNSAAGLADGPLIIIDSLKKPAAERDKLISSVFIEDKTAASKMSIGHRQLAEQMQSKFEPLQKYYKAAAAGGLQRVPAWVMSTAFRREVPDNYSPTSYLVDTLLPSTNSRRTMDYVATIVIE